MMYRALITLDIFHQILHDPGEELSVQQHLNLKHFTYFHKLQPEPTQRIWKYALPRPRHINMDIARIGIKNMCHFRKHEADAKPLLSLNHFQYLVFSKLSRSFLHTITYNLATMPERSDRLADNPARLAGPHRHAPREVVEALDTSGNPRNDLGLTCQICKDPYYSLDDQY